MKLYFIGNEKAKILKIGVSQHPPDRLWELQRHCPYELELFATLDCGEHDAALEHEDQFHDHLKTYRIRGEWFHFEDGVRYVTHVAKRGDLVAALSAARNVGQFHDERPGLSCSFCGAPRSAVKHLIAGAKGYICDACVTLSAEVIAEKDRTQRGGSTEVAQANEQQA